MSDTSRPPAPRLHRTAIWFLASVLALLFYWALDFVVSDIGRVDGPTYDEVFDEVADAPLRTELERLDKQRSDAQRQRTNSEQDSTRKQRQMDATKQRLDQYIADDKNDRESGEPRTPEGQANLDGMRTDYRDLAAEYNDLEDSVTAAIGVERTAADMLRDLEERRKDDDKRVRDAYDLRRSRHRTKLAALKLVCILPVVVLGAWLVLTRRRSLYAAIFYAWLIAGFLVMARVMHAYFPREWFRYIAVGAGIAIVTAFLVQVVKMVAAPKRDLLLRRYREAYGQHRCPICAYQIMRGPLKHARWTAKGPAGVGTDAAEADETPYTCPSCGSGLYHECDTCESVRHTLLPYCDSCGAEKEATA